MKPLAVLAPGFGRHAGVLRRFAQTLADAGCDVVIKNLPGHATFEPLLLDLTVESLGRDLGAWIAGLEPSRQKILVGESLSGLAALLVAQAPPPDLAAVFVVDPPLTMLKQAAIRFAFQDLPDPDGLWAAYAEPAFGLRRESGRVVAEERDYRSYLAHSPAIPVHVLAGGRLGAVEGLDPAPPSVLDADDRALVRSAAGFRLHELGPDVGHLILDEAGEDAATLIVRLAAPDLAAAKS